MKRNCFVALSLLCFLISACSQAIVETPAIISPVPPATQTPTLSPAPTATPQPTLTPAPSTLTPLPAIPTFTPTFDVRTIVTATPAPKAECPKEKLNTLGKIFDGPKRLLSDEERKEFAQKTLRLLNQGMPKVNLTREFSNAPTYGIAEIIEKDVTNDGVPELIATIENGFTIYKCNEGNYEIILQWWGFDTLKFVRIESIKDMNSDGIPEIIAALRACSGSGCMGIRIFEWDGTEIKNIVKVSNYDPTTNTTTTYDSMGMDAPEGESIIDINGDGTQELILTGGIGIRASGQVAMRPLVDIYMWDGSAFALYDNGFTKPEYRFQTIQDADREAIHGRWNKAFFLYQDVIFGKLDWWSTERKKDLMDKMDAQMFHSPTPVTMALEDKTEYPKLAAYAYYRMIILHIKLGEMDAAQIQYTTLQEKFPAGSPGHPYAEMATDFWDAYQTTDKMYDACAAAIAYADAHPEILTVLGSDYHGWQSHIYVPADVCPFR